MTPVLPRGQERLQVVAAAHSAVLSARDVAAQLRVSTSTVYGLCRRGELPHVRVSNAIRVRAEDVEAYLRRAQGDG